MERCWKTSVCVTSFILGIFIQQVSPAAIWLLAGQGYERYTKFHFCTLDNRNLFIGIGKAYIDIQDLDAQTMYKALTVTSFIDLYSVSADCRSLAVLHYSEDGQNSIITKFDLSSDSFYIENLGKMDVSSIVMGSNNIVYIFPPKGAGEYTPRCLDISSHIQRECSTCAGVFDSSISSSIVTTRMHPNGQWIYASTGDNHIHRYVISGSCLKGEKLNYDKWGVYEYGNNWWFSADDSRLLTPSGFSFKTTSSTGENLMPMGTISKGITLHSFLNITQRSDGNRHLFALPTASEGRPQYIYIKVYSWPYLSYVNEIQFPYPASALSTHAQGIQVLGQKLYTYGTYFVDGGIKAGFSTVDISNIQQVTMSFPTSGKVFPTDSFSKVWLINSPDDYVEFCNVNGVVTLAGLNKRMVSIAEPANQRFNKTYTLPMPGLRMAFSPDCKNLVVVHVNYVTVIDVTSLSTETTLHVPAIRGATSVSVKDDGIAYIFNEGYPKTCFNWRSRSVGSCTDKCQSMTEIGGYLHPADQTLFALQTTPGANAVKKYLTDQQCLSYSKSTPGYIAVTGNKLWFADNGNLVILQNGQVLKSQDMTSVIKLEGDFKWQQTFPVTPKDVYAAKDKDNFLSVYHEQSLGLKGGVMAPKLDCSYILPQKIFFDTTGGTIYVYGLFYKIKEATYHTGIGIATQFPVKDITTLKNELEAEWDTCYKNSATTELPWWMYQMNQPNTPPPTVIHGGGLTSSRWKTTRTTTYKPTRSTTTAPTRRTTILEKIKSTTESTPAVLTTLKLDFSSTTTFPVWLFPSTTHPPNWSPDPTSTTVSQLQPGGKTVAPHLITATSRPPGVSPRTTVPATTGQRVPFTSPTAPTTAGFKFTSPTAPTTTVSTGSEGKGPVAGASTVNLHLLSSLVGFLIITIWMH